LTSKRLGNSGRLECDPQQPPLEQVKAPRLELAPPPVAASGRLPGST